MAINSSGDITLEGTLTAENYVVSSSVTNQTIAGVSGSTIFGDDLDDAHQITGSLSITGSGEVFIIPSWLYLLPVLIVASCTYFSD